MQLLEVDLIRAVGLGGLVDALDELPVGATLGPVLGLVNVRGEGREAKGEAPVAELLTLLLPTALKVGPDALEADAIRDGVHGLYAWQYEQAAAEEDHEKDEARKEVEGRPASPDAQRLGETTEDPTQERNYERHRRWQRHGGS